MKHSADRSPVRLKLPATLDSLDPFQEFVRGQIQDAACSTETQFKIQLALEEAVVNIIHYAYSQGDGGWIELVCRRERGGEQLGLEIRDAGRAFDPLAHAPPNLSASLEQRDIGGLGVFLIRQMATNVEYRREDDTNVLILEFSLDAARSDTDGSGMTV